MTSRIEAGMTIEGSIRGEGELEVAGRVRGALTIDGKLTVEVGGIVEADVEAGDIEVAGLLSGSATAHNTVQVVAGGRMEARVKAPRLLVDDGALFRGDLQAQTVDDAPTVQRSVGPLTRKSLPPPRGASTATLPKPSAARLPVFESEPPTADRTVSLHHNADRTVSLHAPTDRTIPRNEGPPRTGPRPARSGTEAPASRVRGRAPAFSVPGRPAGMNAADAKGRSAVAAATPNAAKKAAGDTRGAAPPGMPGLPKGRTAISRRGDGT